MLCEFINGCQINCYPLPLLLLQDVRVQPEFVTVHKQDRDLNAVRFDVKVDEL